MPEEPLTSWKAIATVFGRDVRTVQRWEKEQGLPVHRHLHHRRHSVWANREELDAWWRQRGAALAAEEAPLQAAAAPPVAGAPRATPTRVQMAAGFALLSLVAVSLSGGEQAAMPPLTSVTLVGSVPGAPNITVKTSRDLNGDGMSDLVVQPEPSNEIHLYFGPRSAARGPDVRVTSANRQHLHTVPIGDVDGDGIHDIAFSLMNSEPESYHATGPTYLMRGRRNWPSSLELPRDADSTLAVDPGPDIRLIACSAPDGVDLNRDGLADLVLGGGDYSPPGRRSAGAVFVMFGRREWAGRLDVAAEADVTIHGSHTGHALTGLCATGDFNADGLPELAVVAADSTLWGLRGNRGAVYVFAGRDPWPRLLDAERDALARLSADHPASWTAQPQLVDVNGDGADDLVAAMMRPDPSVSGSLAILFGGKQRRGPIAEGAADVLIQGGGRFAFALSAGDLDHDGRADLLVTAPDTATLHVIPGRADWRPRGPVEHYSRSIRTRAGARLGGSQFALGDFDADGVDDVAIEVNAQSVGLLKPALPLTIDVRPSNAHNVIVPGGVVAIGVWLQGVPADELDVASLRVGGAAPTHSTSDADRGGLQIYFEANALRLSPSATRLTVVGRTRGGIPVAGSDRIVVAPPQAASVH